MLRADAAALHVGQQLGQVLDPTHADQPAVPWFITPLSACSIGSFVNLGPSAVTSGTWGAVNDPVAVPFWLQTPETVYQLGWYNGSVAGGHVDVGVYDSAWVRKVSSGSTVGSGNSTLQFVDVADTVLVPGKYYMVMSLDDVTANRIALQVQTVAALALAGVYDSTTDAFPLPDPLTNMALAATYVNVPFVVVALRTVV